MKTICVFSKKFLIFVILFLLHFVTLKAASINSPVDEQIIAYLPEKGDAVKKDEPLVKMKSDPVDMEIKMALMDLEFAKLNKKDKEKDLKRYTILKNKNHLSLEEWQRSQLFLEEAKSYLATCQSRLDYLELKKAKMIIKAPYNCTVTRVILATGSGVKYGTAILEIEKINQE